MTQLPEAFTTYTRQLMGEERFERYMKAFEEETPVSIRLNPKKASPDHSHWRGDNEECGVTSVVGGEQVPWCENGYYLPKRPNFTMDPLLHAGCYYVQEAASMFLDQVLRSLPLTPSHWRGDKETQSKERGVKCEGMALDMCAAPGGKSTLLRSVLPENWVLYSNEPIRNRANILKENVTKWGYDNHIVTNLYPKDYRKSKQRFDLILCDVPCSGEGMFRKDEATIREWSPQQVEKCWKLQREIVSDAWACLNDGGLLVYSTCTFNTKENEENVRWMMEELGAEVLPVETKPEWNITGSLLDGFNEPVYRFIPGITRGEGLFMCVVRKAQGNDSRGNGGTEVRGYENTSSREKKERRNTSRTFGLEEADPRTHVPSKIVNLSYQQAIAYLRGEALVLPEDTPRGIVEVGFMGYRLGEMKNIGTRANNLYPKEWRIKTTHIPNEYEAILRHT